MKNLILITAVTFALMACDITPQTPKSGKFPVPEVQKKTITTPPVSNEGSKPNYVNSDKLKQDSLDVVYGWSKAFMQSRIVGDELEVYKLQTVLRAWPESQQYVEEPCYMQLRNETARILNILDDIYTKTDRDEPDFKFQCRQQIGYKYDEVRINAFWNKLQ